MAGPLRPGRTRCDSRANARSVQGGPGPHCLPADRHDKADALPDDAGMRTNDLSETLTQTIMATQLSSRGPATEKQTAMW